MPVKAVKRGSVWRIVEAATGKISKTPLGNPRDGGGHKSKSKAQAQARAMNAAHRKKKS